MFSVAAEDLCLNGCSSSAAVEYKNLQIRLLQYYHKPFRQFAQLELSNLLCCSKTSVEGDEVSKEASLF